MALKLTRKGVVVISSLIALFLLVISGLSLLFLMNNDDIVGPGDGEASAPNLDCSSLHQGVQTCSPVGSVYCETGAGKGCTWKLQCFCDVTGGDDYYQWVDSGQKCAEMSECPAPGGDDCSQADCDGAGSGPGAGANDNGGQMCFCGSFQCSTVNGSQCSNRCDDNCESFSGKLGCGDDPRKPNDQGIPVGCFARQIDYYPSGGYVLCPRTLSGADCEPKKDPPVCNEGCSTSNPCAAGFVCDTATNTCRNNDCKGETDCTCPPPVPKPICESLTMTTTGGVGFDKVTSLDQEVNITVKGKRGDGGPAQELAIYAAINGQNNSNNKDFICTPDNYYCGGPKVWALVGKQSNTSTLTVKTTFNQIKAKLLALGTTISVADIEKHGIVLTANVTGVNNLDICSSNIAYNGGMGAYYNNGKWDVACDGGCVRWLLYQPPDQPPPPEIKACNETCSVDSDCEGDLECRTVNNVKTCRNPKCDAETDCTCTAPPAEPYCGDKTCNQASEMCENSKSCSDGSSVTCRANCTFCGDGKENGNEQCDDGNDIDDDECRNNCTYPNCGDGIEDPGEECDDGDDIDDNECSNDCKEPKPPVWTIEKEGAPVCVEGKEVYADVLYKITVTNTGTGKGEIDKVVDTPDQKVLENWIYPNSIKPTTGSYVNGKITWSLTGEEKTLQPGETKEFIYSLNVPKTGFGTITNKAELYPVAGDVITVSNQESVMCTVAGPLPETGLFDSTMAKVGIGLVLISLSGLYFYWGGTDSYLMRLMYKEERVARNREKFEDGMKDEE